MLAPAAAGGAGERPGEQGEQHDRHQRRRRDHDHAGGDGEHAPGVVQRAAGREAGAAAAAVVRDRAHGQVDAAVVDAAVERALAALERRDLLLDLPDADLEAVALGIVARVLQRSPAARCARPPRRRACGGPRRTPG